MGHENSQGHISVQRGSSTPWGYFSIKKSCLMCTTKSILFLCLFLNIVSTGVQVLYSMPGNYQIKFCIDDIDNAVIYTCFSRKDLEKF